MNRNCAYILISLLAVLVAGSPASAHAKASKNVLARGRYLVRIGGCNDCHTPGYPQSGGKIPEKVWLTGNPVGFQGPWGTSYPANLRLYAQSVTFAQWMKRGRSKLLPPMPWFALRDMSNADLRAVYEYIRSLGPKGKPAPQSVPPGKKVATPYIVFVPQNMPNAAAANHN